jgi:RNA-directed DNA polymerase
MRNTSYIEKSTLSHDIQWKSINWFHVNRYVEEMQQRIYRAECLGNKRKVRELQRLLVRSKAMLLLSIRKVTQTNKGKRTNTLQSVTI